MAERRMFAKTIVLSDAFLDMPLSARCLYFTLNMFADDEGFINNPKSIIRQCGASEDDINILILKKFVIPFQKEGIVVIKHWLIHNLIKNDRFKETKYKELRDQLRLDENKSYTMSEPKRNQIGTETEPQISIDKNSTDKNKDEEIYKLAFVKRWIEAGCIEKVYNALNWMKELCIPVNEENLAKVIYVLDDEEIRDIRCYLWTMKHNGDLGGENVSE